MDIFVKATEGQISIELLRSGVSDPLVISADVNKLTLALVALFKGTNLPSVKPSNVGVYHSSSMDYPLEYGFIEHGDAHRLFDTAWERAVDICDGLYTYSESLYLGKPNRKKYSVEIVENL